MSISVTVHGIQTAQGPTNHGRWATTDITTTDGSDTLVYTVPLTIDYAIASISVCNRAATPTEPVSIAIAQADTPLDREFIEWQSIIIPKGVLEITQLMIEPDTRIIIRVGV
jgi:hypothetical protein